MVAAWTSLRARPVCLTPFQNKQGDLNQMRLDHKVVSVLASPSAKERCPVYVLDCYINELWKEAEQKDLF